MTPGARVPHTGKVPPNNTRKPIPTGHISTSCGRLSIEATRTESIARGSARYTALFQLATQLPAAVLARMLGIHISDAAAWQRASASAWTHYAADISRLHNTNTGVTGENC